MSHNTNTAQLPDDVTALQSFLGFAAADALSALRHLAEEFPAAQSGLERDQIGLVAALTGPARDTKTPLEVAGGIFHSGSRMIFDGLASKDPRRNLEVIEELNAEGFASLVGIVVMVARASKSPSKTLASAARELTESIGADGLDMWAKNFSRENFAGCADAIDSCDEEISEALFSA